MGCLSGHVHYATRILGFWMLTRAVTRSVAVGCFVVIVGWLLAAEARGGKGGEKSPSLSSVDVAPQDARGRRTCYCAASAACCCCWSSWGVVCPAVVVSSSKLFDDYQFSRMHIHAHHTYLRNKYLRD